MNHYQDHRGDSRFLHDRVDGTQLSQEDCVIWDEADPVDLRRLASPSAGTPASERQTPSSGGTSNASSSGGIPVRTRNPRKPRPSLGEVSRLIAVQESVQEEDSDKANDMLFARKRRRQQWALQSMDLADLDSARNRRSSTTPTTLPQQTPTQSTSKSSREIDSKRNEFADLLQQIQSPPVTTGVVGSVDSLGATNERLSQRMTPIIPSNEPKLNHATKGDEFDDLDLSMDDIAALDALIEQRIAEKENLINQLPTLSKEEEALIKSTSTNGQECSRQSAASGEDEEFNDFPDDIDFAAFDQSVHQQLTQQNIDHHLRSQRANVAPGDSPTQSSAQSTNGCLSFSRYRVMSVDVDPKTYTKTVTVTAWRTEMLEEVAYAKSIHKVDEFSRRHQSVKDLVWTADGHIHLRGEWYHTPLEIGDFIHLCSLSGTRRTDVDALPLTLQTIARPGIEDDDYLLIVHPDVLLTPTIISEGVGCSRRAVLKNRLGSTGLTTRAPLLGTMRHQLFEAAMKDKNFSLESTKEHISRIVRENAEGILACDMTPVEAEDELLKFVPQLQSFARHFFNHNSSAGLGIGAILESCGISAPMYSRIQKVKAVEEPVVSPELGLKGNVDMIVEASTASDEKSLASQPTLRTMCVELKTSHIQRTQHAHVAQLALYMSILRSRFVIDFSQVKHQSIGSGMLLYMNNEGFRAVHSHPSLPELKSLIGQRNLVASESRHAARPRGVVLSYQQGQDATREVPHIELLDPSPARLPPVLNTPHMCQKCYMSRECMLYAATEIGMDRIRESKNEVLVKYAGELQTEDLAYFNNFDRLIDLEADAEYTMISQAWLVDATDREGTTSKSVARLVFDPERSVTMESMEALIAFKKEHFASQTNKSVLEPGARVIASYDTHTCSGKPAQVGQQRLPVHLIRGTVERVSPDEISLRATVDDLLRIENYTSRSSPAICHFRLDKDEVATGISTQRQNIVNFVTADKNPQCTIGNRLKRLRDLIIRLHKPSFTYASEESLFKPSPNYHFVPGCHLSELSVEYKTMNPDQRAAIVAAFAAKDYTLIQGFPGSGKTSTIAFVIRLLVAHGKRVLVTSYTNAAVDNVVQKLIANGLSATDARTPSPAVVRIGRPSDCHRAVTPLLSSNIALTLERLALTDPKQSLIHPSATYLRKAVDSARVVAVTTLTAPRSPQLINQQFDVVIVDEAGQISQPTVLGALMAADSFILVGDHMQLPPLVNSELAERGGYGVSMLKHLADAHPSVVKQLSYQYRMNAEVCELSNDLVYNGSLKCGDDSIRDRVLQLPGFPQNVAAAWLGPILDPIQPVIFVNTDDRVAEHFTPLESALAGKTVNGTEALVVREIVQALVSCGAQANAVGVISPFRAQIDMLKKCEFVAVMISAGLEVSTIDRFQGRDKSVIILSFVRCNEKRKIGRLLEDVRRLNVAVTRAKCKLVMVGSFSTIFHGSKAMKPALCRLKNRKRVISIPDHIRGAA